MKTQRLRGLSLTTETINTCSILDLHSFAFSTQNCVTNHFLIQALTIIDSLNLTTT